MSDDRVKIPSCLQANWEISLLNTLTDAMIVSVSNIFNSDNIPSQLILYSGFCRSDKEFWKNTDS